MGLKEEVIEMKKEVKAVKEQSLAMELLSDYKKANKRQFTIILVILTMWFITIGYLVYILNDIGEEEIDRMSGEYGRYMENRSRYGAGEETDSQQQKQMLRETLQRSMM